MYKKISFITLLILFVCQSCGLSNKEIEDKYWKLSDIKQKNPNLPLHHQIDHISFEENKYYVLKKDSIYRENKPYAVIINRQKGTSTSIQIVLIENLDTLRYVAK